MRTCIRRLILLALLMNITNAALASEDSSPEEAIFTCWSVYSTLGIIGREDGQSLVEELFKDQARSVWKIGLEGFGIQFLDQRYTSYRDFLLEGYRAGARSYDELMQVSSFCDQLLFGA